MGAKRHHRLSVNLPPVSNACDTNGLLLVVNLIHNTVLSHADSIQVLVPH